MDIIARKFFLKGIVLLLIISQSIYGYAVNDRDSILLNCYKVKNRQFHEFIKTEIERSDSDHIFLISVIKRNDTLFTYIGHSARCFLPELCFVGGRLFFDNNLEGYCSISNRDCYIFGKPSRFFFRNKREVFQLPRELSWFKDLPNITSREDSLLPVFMWTFENENGEKTTVYNSKEYPYDEESNIRIIIDPFLCVAAYHKRKFVMLDWDDDYPYSLIEEGVINRENHKLLH